MKVFRASKSEEVFIGAHFATDKEEAEAYSRNHCAGSDLSTDGKVRKYEASGEVLYCPRALQLAEFVFDYLSSLDEEEIEEELDELESLGSYIEKNIDDCDGEIHYIDAIMNGRDVDWRGLGCDGFSYTFELIEGIDRVREILEESDYAWIQFDEPSVGEMQHHTCETIRYLGGGEIIKIN